MARTTQRLKDASFNLRLDPALKAAFTAATEAEAQPAARVLRAFMRVYVKRRTERAFLSQAQRQSQRVARESHRPASDEQAVMREIETELAEAALWQD